MCYASYENPRFGGVWGCQSVTPPGSTGSSSAGDGHEEVQKFCSNNPNCIGYYSDIGNWNIATDIDPSKCTENKGSGYGHFIYKQKVN